MIITIDFGLFFKKMEDYKYLFFNFLHSLIYKSKFGNNYVNWKEFPFKIPAKATRMRFDGTFLGFSLKTPFFSFSNFTPFFSGHIHFRLQDNPVNGLD